MQTHKLFDIINLADKKTFWDINYSFVLQPLFDNSIVLSSLFLQKKKNNKNNKQL